MHDFVQILYHHLNVRIPVGLCARYCEYDGEKCTLHFQVDHSISYAGDSLNLSINSPILSRYLSQLPCLLSSDLSSPLLSHLSLASSLLIFNKFSLIHLQPLIPYFDSNLSSNPRRVDDPSVHPYLDLFVVHSALASKISLILPCGFHLVHSPQSSSIDFDFHLRTTFERLLLYLAIFAASHPPSCPSTSGHSSDISGTNRSSV